MELRHFPEVKRARKLKFKQLGRVVIALVFIFGVALYASWHAGGIEHRTLLIIAAIFGGYMAMNIGANDVANNVGPAVGSGALSLMGAIVIAAVFEAAGALIAGADVVGTIRKGIIDPDLIANTQVFVWIMMAALLAGALWLNLATAMGAPVSTTHSIVGGVMGAGIAAAGFAIVNWVTMGKIAASWVVSPVLGGAIAALFLYIIKKNVIYQENKIEAAKKWVPIYIAIMTWAFSSYLIVKGLKHLVKVPLPLAVVIGFFIALGFYLVLKPRIAKKAESLPNERESINQLFTIPLIFSAALLSFAHGANDVANAVGPLAGISDALMKGEFGQKAPIPLWVMMVGALGISLGLALYGPKLIKKVGSEITELDPIRAFCVALAAAITVIVASALGLPVSSTHIAVGGVFGVGFLREYLMKKQQQAHELEEELMEEFKEAHLEKELEKLEEYTKALEALGDPKKADPFLVKALIEKINKEKMAIAKLVDGEIKLTKIEKKALKAVKKYELVERGALKMIVAAWIITVPAAGLLAAMIYFMLRGMMLP